MTAEHHLEMVSRLGGIGRDEALRVMTAVLETLAERIGSGQVDDLEDWIPPEFHAALERGRAQHPDAVAMELDEFLARVGRRAEVDRDAALLLSRVVFAALREGSSPKEFADIIAQLRKDEDEALIATL
jgi:uncharacterized protein (DUF2267 family)